MEKQEHIITQAGLKIGDWCKFKPYSDIIWYAKIDRLDGIKGIHASKYIGKSDHDLPYRLSHSGYFSGQGYGSEYMAVTSEEREWLNEIERQGRYFEFKPMVKDDYDIFS